MTNKSARIDGIVSYLNGITAVTSIATGGIFYGEPISEIQQTYIVVDLIEQNTRVADKEALVDVRIIGSSSMTRKALIDLQDIITDALATDANTPVYNLGAFNVYSVVEWG